MALRSGSVVSRLSFVVSVCATGALGTLGTLAALCALPACATEGAPSAPVIAPAARAADEPRAADVRLGPDTKPESPRRSDPVLPAAPAPDRDAEPARPSPSPTPTLSLESSGVSGGAFRLAGTVRGARVPAIFSLLTEDGCRAEARLPTTTSGVAFTTALDAASLADAFSCAIEASAADESLDAITVTPTAELRSAAPGLALDPGVALVAASLDASDGDLVRVTVLSSWPVAKGELSIAGRTYGARVTGIDALGGTASAIFDVPALAWARATLSGDAAEGAIVLDSGERRTLSIRPGARAERVADEVGDAEDDDGC